METSYPKNLYRTNALDSAWVQLPILLAIGVLAPSLSWFGGNIHALTNPSTAHTLYVAAFASVLTWYSLEKLRYFAKARRLSYVFPVNAMSFGLALSLLVVLRLPYSIFVLALTFVFVTATSYMICVLTRNNSAEQWLVPGGRVDEAVPDLSNYRVLNLEQFAALIDHPVQNCAIVADLHYSHGAEWEELIAEAAVKGMAVYHYRQILEMQRGQVRIEHLRENTFGSLIPNLAYTGIKRVIDLSIAVTLLPLLMPLFVFVGIVTKATSRGPVFYHQERVGYRGQIFRMHKFRSMTVRAIPNGEHERMADAVTRDDDDRITSWGKFIRRYRIDELPQIFNILKGEMSWIGPRPEAEALSRLYQKEIPFYRYRHIVRPGITGWAQVNQGHVADVSEVSEKLRYDFYYIRHISLWLDALIALKTFRIILFGFGAR